LAGRSAAPERVRLRDWERVRAGCGGCLIAAFVSGAGQGRSRLVTCGPVLPGGVRNMLAMAGKAR